MKSLSNENVIPGQQISIDEVIVHCINAGMLAPSTHNSQPWKVSYDGNDIKIVAIHSKHMKASDPEKTYLWLSIGMFVENVSQCANFYGYSTEHHVKGDEVHVKLKKSGKSKGKDSLFLHVKDRYSEKRIFSSKPLTKPRVTGLNSFDDSVTIITDRSEISKIADIQYGSSRSYKNNRQFAKELSKWLRLSKRHKTGMNHRSNAVGSWSKMFVGKTVLKVTPKVLDKMAIKYLHLVNCSSAVGWISQSNFDKQYMINTGMLLEKISLWATSNGLSLTPLAAIVESEEGKKHLCKLQKEPNLTPVIFFRISDIKYPIHHTPRKTFKMKEGI